MAPPVELERALPGTPLPVSAPLFYPAFVASYPGYQEYVGQIVSKESEPFSPIDSIK
jgi:hypothetical protein